MGLGGSTGCVSGWTGVDTTGAGVGSASNGVLETKVSGVIDESSESSLTCAPVVCHGQTRTVSRLSSLIADPTSLS